MGHQPQDNFDKPGQDREGGRQRSRAALHALCALPVVGLIAAQVRPVLHHGDRAVLATLDGVDALLQSGIIAWSARHCLRPAIWVDLPIFYPASGALTYMDSLLGQALLVAPAQLFGEPTPALLYNLACLLTLILVAVSATALWRAGAAGSPADFHPAGLWLCALFLLGSPFTAWQLGLLNQISPPWVVLLIAALWFGWLRFTDGRPAARWWWSAAACLVLQAAWGWYGFADAVFALTTAAVIGVWQASRRRKLRALAQGALPPAMVAAALVIWLAVPYLAQKAREPQYVRTAAEVQAFSADLNQFANLGPHRATWEDWLGKGAKAEERAPLNLFPVLHPGWLTLIFATLGVCGQRQLSRRQRDFGWLLAAIGLCGLAMAFGDSVSMPGTQARAPLPFGILRDIAPPFRAFRAPVRFAFLATIAMAWWATCGVGVLARLTGSRGRAWVIGGVLLAVTLESVPMGMLAVPVRVDGRRVDEPALAALPAGAILTLPAPPTEQDEGPNEAHWLHRALATGRPVTGGVSGWVPPFTRNLRTRLAACEAGQRAPGPLLAELSRQGVVAVEICLLAGDTTRAAFWDRALKDAGYTPCPSVPGYCLYLPPE